MKSLLFLLLFGLLFACFKKKFEGPNSFQDGFEEYTIFEDLFPEDDSKWNHSQITKSGSSVTVVDTFSHSGTSCLKFDAEISTDELLSKCSIVKQKMAFYDGETVRIEAWYYIDGNMSLDWLFLLDLEEQTAIGAGPGLRLAILDNHIVLNNKYTRKNTRQTDGSEIDVPRNEWFKLTFEVKLDQRKKGWAKVLQNDELILEKQNFRSLPSDKLYNIQGTKGMYSSIEIGATANSFDNGAVVFIDDLSVSTTN